MKKTRDNYTFLTEAPVHKVVFTMAIPTIISMLSTSMYNLADTYFVGSINTQSVAAVGVSFAMMAVIQAVGFSMVMELAIISLVSWAQRGRKCQKDGSNRLCFELSYRFGHRNSGSTVSYSTLSYLGFYPHHPSLYRALFRHHLTGCSFHDDLADTQQHDAFSGQHNVCDERHHVGRTAESDSRPFAHSLF